MKKILVLALMLSAVQLGAQTKDAEAAVKAYEKSKADITGKKAQDPGAWVRFGDNITAAFDVPSKSLWVGLTSLEAKLVLKDQRSIGTEQMELQGESYELVHYEDKDLYYGADGKLAFWQVKQPVLSGDLLSEAYNAYAKAGELDAKGAQNKGITSGMTMLQSRYATEAMSAYRMGRFSDASKNFEAAANCLAHSSIGKIDTVLIYYAGQTAKEAKEYDRATILLQRAIDLNYTENGNAYSLMAECYKILNQPEKVENALVTGFTKFPSNQAILVSLINMYMEQDKDPAKVLEYIHTAQKNEPSNASLYYAEGEVWKKLKNNDKAIESYKKSSEVDPNYFFGSYNIGILYYDLAVELQNKAADEPDDKKYQAMLEEMDVDLAKAIEPFEKCYAKLTEADFKAVVADYLRNIYFRLRSKNPDYEVLYEKYKALSEAGKE